MQSKYEKKEPKNILRLISLLLALLLWVNFSGRVDVAGPAQKVIAQVPLVYEGIPENIRVSNDQSYLVNITVTGPEKVLDQLKPSDVGISLSLEGRREGRQTFPLMPDDVRLPARFKELGISSIIPGQVELILEEHASKRLKLIYMVEGEPEPNYEMLGQKSIPEYVTIQGPARQIRDLDILLGETVNIDGATGDLSGRIRLSQELPRGSYIIENQTQLRYEIKIAEKEKTVAFKNPFPLVVEIDETESAMWTEWQVPSPNVKLSVSGPVSVINWFDPAWIMPKIRLSSSQVLEENDSVVVAGNGTVPGAEGGPQGDPTVPPVESKVVRFKIVPDWRLPDEAIAAEPEWLARVTKMKLKWTPDIVEVRKP